MSEPVLTPIGDLSSDRQNANRGTDRGREALRHSLETYGAGRSILLDSKGRCIAGNKTLAEAVALGHAGVQVVETDGSHLIAVKRTDLDLDDKAARELAFFDNRVSELDLNLDVDLILRADAEGIDLSHLWTDDELKELLAGPVFPEFDEESFATVESDLTTVTFQVPIGQVAEIEEQVERIMEILALKRSEKGQVLVTFARLAAGIPDGAIA